MDTLKSWAGLIGVLMLFALYIPLLLILIVGFSIQEFYARHKTAKR